VTARPLFDRALQRQRLARAQRRGPADFLLGRAAEDLSDRLSTVLRDFPLAIDAGTPGEAFAQVLAKRDRHVVRLRPASGPLAANAYAVIDPALPPLATSSADLIVSGYALHTVDDLPGALIQLRRALKPDGLLVACLAGGATLWELRQVLAEAESEILGGASPRIFPFADVRDMGALLQRAGFALPVTDSDSVSVRYDHLFALIADLRAMGQTNFLVDRLKFPLPRRFFARAGELYAPRFADRDGRIRATFETLWLSGWAPHESQQKPLKPGSAKMKLAEALGVIEKPLP